MWSPHANLHRQPKQSYGKGNTEQHSGPWDVNEVVAFRDWTRMKFKTLGEKKNTGFT